MTCELVSPERVVWSGPASFVVARSVDGELGILPRHAPLLAALDIGVVRIRPADGGEEIVAAVDGGFLSVSPDGDTTAVSLLAEVAVLAADISTADAQRALAEAKALDPDADPDARSKVRSAEARLRAVGASV